jgi:hypothetical protein
MNMQITIKLRRKTRLHTLKILPVSAVRQESFMASIIPDA